MVGAIDLLGRYDLVGENDLEGLWLLLGGDEGRREGSIAV